MGRSTLEKRAAGTPKARRHRARHSTRTDTAFCEVCGQQRVFDAWIHPVCKGRKLRRSDRRHLFGGKG